MTRQPTPSVSLDDVPGDIPKVTLPEDIKEREPEIAKEAVAKINTLQAADFTQDALWRDLLAFTGSFRTFYSSERIVDLLTKLKADKSCSAFEATGSSPRTVIFPPGNGWVDVDVVFTTQLGSLEASCAGILSMVPGEDGRWRIWLVRTWVEHFVGHGNPDELEPVLANGAVNGGSPPDDQQRVFDVLAVGGGQAGLGVAGRAKALGLSHILIDAKDHIGSVWEDRYESLKWHTLTEYGHLPFGRTYEADAEYMLPAKLIGKGYGEWARKYGINSLSGFAVKTAQYDAGSKLWTVEAQGHGQSKSFVAKNLVLCTGAGSTLPKWPEWASTDKIKSSGFKGTVIHGKDYHSCKGFEGKRGAVIGTANTAHDVAEDMANCGMHTTMIQRGHTFVLPVEWLHDFTRPHYNSDVDTGLSDRRDVSMPTKVTRTMVLNGFTGLINANRERFEALEKAGFKVDWYPDLITTIYSNFGGHYVDIGASARIANGEIKCIAKPVKGLTSTGLEFQDGSKVDVDFLVVCTGYNHDHRIEAAKIIGEEAADKMDDFWGLDAEGEVRAVSRYAGHDNLYYQGGDVRTSRWYSRFLALQIQAEALGQPLQRFQS